MRKLAIALAAGAALLAGPALLARDRPSGEEQLARLLEGRVAGEPVSCIPLSRTSSSRIIDRTAIVYDSGDYPQAQARAIAAARWEQFAERRSQASKEGRYLGIGLANAVKGTGRGPFETGTVRIGTSGRISVYTGATEMGQGLTTALAQICAAEFGVDQGDDGVDGEAAGQAGVGHQGGEDRGGVGQARGFDQHAGEADFAGLAAGLEVEQGLDQVGADGAA